MGLGIAFDGSRDSIEHIEMYKAHMTLHGVSNEMSCSRVEHSLSPSKDPPEDDSGIYGRDSLGLLMNFVSISSPNS